MVGNGIRMRDSFTLNNTNVFAALGTLRKKKKKKSIKLIKDQGSLKKQQEEEEEEEKNPEPQVLWTLTPLIAKSWADVEDDDDYDYFASTAPPQSDLQSDEKEITGLLEESESGEEEDVVDENEEHEPTKVVSSEKEPTITAAVLLPTKDPNRQLSKKELKKKGLAELDAVLAELGYYTKSEASGQDDPNDKKIDKNSKQQKKKDRTLKDAKGTSSMVDAKEKVKKVASMKKKKSSKKMDVAAKAAANEVAVRNAKLAAAKKKEKIHYNQHPLR